MILEFTNWAEDQGAVGPIIFIGGFTFLCCTGLMFPLLAYDIVRGESRDRRPTFDDVEQERQLRAKVVAEAQQSVADRVNRFENRYLLEKRSETSQSADSIALAIAGVFLVVGLGAAMIGLLTA